jgi:hypothetical protein
MFLKNIKHVVENETSFNDKCMFDIHAHAMFKLRKTLFIFSLFQGLTSDFDRREEPFG